MKKFVSNLQASGFVQKSLVLTCPKHRCDVNMNFHSTVSQLVLFLYEEYFFVVVFPHIPCDVCYSQKLIGMNFDSNRL